MLGQITNRGLQSAAEPKSNWDTPFSPSDERVGRQWGMGIPATEQTMQNSPLPRATPAAHFSPRRREAEGDEAGVIRPNSAGGSLRTRAVRRKRWAKKRYPV